MTCNQCLKEFFSHGDVCPNCVEKNNRMDEWYQRENEKIEKKYRREDF